MNIDLLQRVREQIAAEPKAFDMAYYGNATECGTTLCIAGWACVLTGATFDGDRFRRDGQVINADRDAKSQIGLPDLDHLFTPDYWPDGYDDEDPADALRLLDSVIEQGRVWWAE